MKQEIKKTRHITTKTVWLSTLGFILIGLASLLVGLSIYSNSLMQESITSTRTTAGRAAASAQHGTDTVGLARDVMRVYDRLTPEQRSMNGTEEYRDFFRSLDSVSVKGQAHDILINMVQNFLEDVSRIYICSFDEENGIMVYLADSDMENGPFPGEWETVPKDWIRELTSVTSHDRSGAYTPYTIWNTESEGRICLAAFPIRDDSGQNRAYLVAELPINSVITEIIHYAIKVGAVVLALTLLIAFAVGMRMKKTVADPINAIANTAMTYVQDRKNGVDRTDHFSSLGIRTGDELENLTDVMADMEGELIEHEDQIEALLDSLVKALSVAIDERSHYTGKHTQNMTQMAEAYMDWMEAHGNAWQYDETHRRVFIMSVGLHDIGKLTVPLEVMDKATRLGPILTDIRERFARVRLLDRIATLEGRISEAEFLQKQKELEDTLAFIERVNAGGYLSDENLDKVNALRVKTYVEEDGTNRQLLTDDEIAMLSIRKGTLTAEERSLMQGHASSTWNILNQVHFPAQYAYVPMWAASHHELLLGNGYPNGISAASIPKEVRLMTILDIFEALTAKDRPYKTPYPLETAWDILDGMVREGSLDGELLASFKESRAWEKITSEQETDDIGT